MLDGIFNGISKLFKKFFSLILFIFNGLKNKLSFLTDMVKSDTEQANKIKSFIKVKKHNKKINNYI